MNFIFIICLATTILGLPRNTTKSNTNLKLHHDERVIGGSDATPGEFPYQISLQDGSFGYDYHLCGGAIYDEHYVITAAHCVYDQDIENPSYLTVYAGIITLDESDPNEQKISLSAIKIHPGFNSFSLSNDIALLKLSKPLDLLGRYVLPIALPEIEQQSEGTCVLSGWGLTVPGGDISNTLQKVDMAIVSDEDCRATYGESDVEDSMLCAESEGKGGCEGDSGSPFACVNNDGETYLAGIASWANGCALSGYPGVCAEVSYFVEWIEANAT